MNSVSNGSLNRIFVYFVVLFSFAFSTSLIANDDSLQSQKMWTNVVSPTEASASKPTDSPLTARLLELDEISFKSLLDQNGKQGDSLVATPAQNTTNIDNNTIFLPLPDGSEVNLRITPSKVMSDVLAQQYPEIKTWNVTGVSENITGVIDFTYQGFHGMLSMPDGDRIFIEPETSNPVSNQGQLSTQGRYLSFSERLNQDSFSSEFSCGVDDAHDDSTLGFNASARNALVAARLFPTPTQDLITYRLAVAATGEYTQFHGGSIASALSAIVTTISRVNPVFIRDVGIQFELIGEQSDIIYLNPNTDPYTNSDAFQLIQENNLNLSNDGVLNRDRYDIGHVFAAGNTGGLALVGGVCTDAEKAFGATGLSNPLGDTFDLDFVAHELGHQLGGTHTFNSSCGNGNERSAVTAVEPGSGTTIMAYPGICQANDIQNSVDPQFHVVSIDQMRDVTRLGSGNSCGINTSTNNANPTINAGEDTVLPARTPLVLIATGADADNDALSYVWEQSDTGALTDVNIDSGDNALFRSRPLTNDNIRFIPTLSDLFTGNITLGESLPITNRDINMVATVRDGRGGLQADLVNLQMFDTGESFSVTSPSDNLTLRRQDIVEVRWNVAGTNSSPISCANVDIGLATNTGQGIDITTSANDGVAEITIPNDAPALNNARIIVSCSTSNFFNVSSGRLTLLDELGGATFASSEGSGGSGGGSFGLFMLLWGSLLIALRKTLVLGR